jgi:alpha-beta hydrolase superfamily lysophospholipase
MSEEVVASAPMRSDSFTFAADDGHPLFVYRFRPDEGTPLRGIVHIAHGMAEHAARYARVAEALTAAGYLVQADDHRGHGKTARSAADLGFIASAGGFDRCVRDLDQLIARAKEESPGLPVALFGHSMGSFLTQGFLIEHGAKIQAAVLSATAGKPPAIATIGKGVARLERLRRGERAPSKIIDAMSFGQYNKAFAPTRTEFDWLSRDPAEVDKYVADPLCGFSCSTALWVDLLDALSAIARPAAQARIPKELPIYVFSGSEDPVGERTKSVQQLLGAYQRAGLTRVTSRFYPGGRHEMLNETNREEVTRDLVAWLGENLPGKRVA